MRSPLVQPSGPMGQGVPELRTFDRIVRTTFLCGLSPQRVTKWTAAIIVGFYLSVQLWYSSVWFGGGINAREGVWFVQIKRWAGIAATFIVSLGGLRVFGPSRDGVWATVCELANPNHARGECLHAGSRHGDDDLRDADLELASGGGDEDAVSPVAGGSGGSTGGRSTAALLEAARQRLRWRLKLMLVAYVISYSFQLSLQTARRFAKSDSPGLMVAFLIGDGYFYLMMHTSVYAHGVCCVLLLHMLDRLVVISQTSLEKASDYLASYHQALAAHNAGMGRYLAFVFLHYSVAAVSDSHSVWMHEDTGNRAINNFYFGGWVCMSLGVVLPLLLIPAATVTAGAENVIRQLNLAIRRRSSFPVSAASAAAAATASGSPAAGGLGLLSGMPSSADSKRAHGPADGSAAAASGLVSRAAADRDSASGGGGAHSDLSRLLLEQHVTAFMTRISVLRLECKIGAVPISFSLCARAIYLLATVLTYAFGVA